MSREPRQSSRTSTTRSPKAAKAAAPNTGMRLWMVHLREPRHHRDRKVWVTEVIALATTARGAELVVRRQMPQLFAYEPSVRVEPVSGHAVKHLTYQADPIGKE
jgi:hypothetical protein